MKLNIRKLFEKIVCNCNISVIKSWHNNHFSKIENKEYTYFKNFIIHTVNSNNPIIEKLK